MSKKRQSTPRQKAPRSKKAELEHLPVMPLRSTIVYPLGVIGIQIGMPNTLEMLTKHADPVVRVALVVAPGGPDEPIVADTLEGKVGVICRLSDRLNLPGGTVQATVQGIERVRLRHVDEQAGYHMTDVEPVEETEISPEEADQLSARILTTLEALAAEVERIPREVPRILRMNVGNPSRFADLVATLANFSVPSKDRVLQLLDLQERFAFVLQELERELGRLRQVEAAEAEVETAAEVAEGAEPLTRAEQAADLRRQIKRLQAELGEADPTEREVVELFRRIDAADLPARVATQASLEAERLRSVGTASTDAGEIRSYIDWLLRMPWNARAGTGEIDLAQVQKELDDALLGLEEPKERLLDYLAVAKLRHDLRGPIPCLVGPPDVGKSALVEAFARGLGRPLARLELGGRGEAQLIGTRRTRSGAQPGKIAGQLRDVGVKDPVFLLEEIDEIGLGKVEGDPIEALEEALHWRNREEFVDRYLDLPFDLSQAVFLATAQDFYRIPRDLRELMVEIRLAGYTPEEKVEIARDRLVPQLIEKHGLEPGDVRIQDDALWFLARGYARDAGLGLLQRTLSTLLRTRARAKAVGDEGLWKMSPRWIEEILGLPRYIATVAESAPEVGVVTGLAWTASGGEIMFIEALRMPGSGRLIITGSLGDVMRESVNAAYSYVRSRGDDLRIDDETFRKSDVHVHFPVGAIPKDGPSAGIAVTLAVASTLSNRPVRHDIAMTGEVTLRGKVLEIGGVKEKVLAAYRVGIREIIMPVGNERDLRDVPDDIRDGVTFHFVERMDDVLDLAILDGARGPTAAKGESAAEAERRRRRKAKAKGKAKRKAKEQGEGKGEGKEEQPRAAKEK